MKYNVNFQEIVNQLVKVFSNESFAAEYNREGLQYEGVCGWCGVMAPLSRPAYVEAFGALTVAAAEQMARDEIKARNDRHNATHYHAHTIEADNLQGAPAVGGFFWAANSGLKCDDGRGVFGEINALLWRSEFDESEHDRREFNQRPARLCQVREVYTVTPEEFDRPELADELTAQHQPQGGSASDDIDEGADWYDLTEEQRATLYTFGALVTDGRRYYLIDTEGYDYPRYIYTPQAWRETLADITAAERERIEAEQRRKAQEEEDARAQRMADYRARCNKWAHLMEDVRPLEAKESEAWAAVVAAHYRKGAESKAHTAARRATDNARKRNILAMCRAAFPGVKFSVSVHRGWGADFALTWTDGPTLEEFRAATDLGLFCSRYDTFDGMTDCADVVRAEFTDFSALTMGSNGGNVEVSREMSEDVKAAIIAEIVAAVPEYDNRTETGYYQDVTATEDQARRVAARLGLSLSVLYCTGAGVFDPMRWSAEELARHAWNVTSYYTEPTAPTEGGKAQSEPQTTAEGAQAPEGLELIETAEGVAVVGDSRTTYRHRKEIKAHGAKWNKTAQRWEAVDAEGVEMLRQWFGVSASEQTAPEVDTVAESADTLQRAKEITPDPFEGAPQHVRELVDEIKAKGAKGEHGAKRAELLRLLAEQWQEKPEYFKQAGAAQVDGTRPETPPEVILCEVVAIVAAHQCDECPPQYLQACELRAWFCKHATPAEAEAVPVPVSVYADTREEAKARGDYWRGITYNTQTGQGAPDYAPICKESRNTPAEVWAYLFALQQRGEISRLCRFVAPCGGVAIRYATDNICKPLQAVERTEGQAWEDFPDQLGDLKTWATSQRKTA